MQNLFGDIREQIASGTFSRNNDGTPEPERVLPDCGCGGRGFFGEMKMVDGRWETEVTYCVCRKKETRDRHVARCIADCRMDEASGRRMSFNLWNQAYNLECNPALAACQEFAEAGSKYSRRWIFLRGQSGLGKTHLAIATTWSAAQNGIQAEYWRIQDLVAQMHESLQDGSLRPFTGRLKALPMLIVDDLGTAVQREFADQTLEDILDVRHFHRRPTMLTTNQTLSEFSPRLKSRLTDIGVVDLIELQGTDVRPRLEQ